MKVVVTGGGTAGHVYPALCVIEELKKRISNLEVIYLGTGKGLEEELVKKEGIPFFPIRAKGLERKISLSLISTMFVFLKGVKDSFIILRLE
ncbi:MAG: glycosyltransferase, partial [Actinomycetia bacterium]|nr:glycosyltransferase [Actinomycetes bacterium]